MKLYINSKHENPDRESVVNAMKAIEGFVVADPWATFEKPPVIEEGADLEDNSDAVDFSIASQEAVVWCDAMAVLHPVDETVAAFAGMAHGYGKPIYVLKMDGSAPSLVYTLAESVVDSVAALMLALDGRDPTDDNGVE